MTATCEPAPESVADVAETLMGEYGEQCSLATITATVLDALRDLTGEVPDDSLAEMLYRLARQRLGT